mgnify:CR=1 FL=1
MEAKGSEDEAKDSKEEEPPSKVVIDLLNFAMKVVHEEMSGFFEQHCVLWDYQEEDLKKITAGEGETLEQHAVFTQYLEQIMLHADKLAFEANLAQDLVAIQMKELDYLYKNLANLATSSAVLVGFGFSGVAATRGRPTCRRSICRRGSRRSRCRSSGASGGGTRTATRGSSSATRSLATISSR